MMPFLKNTSPLIVLVVFMGFLLRSRLFVLVRAFIFFNVFDGFFSFVGLVFCFWLRVGGVEEFNFFIWVLIKGALIEGMGCGLVV